MFWRRRDRRLYHFSVFPTCLCSFRVVHASFHTCLVRQMSTGQIVANHTNHAFSRVGMGKLGSNHTFRPRSHSAPLESHDQPRSPCGWGLPLCPWLSWPAVRRSTSMFDDVRRRSGRTRHAQPRHVPIRLQMTMCRMSNVARRSFYVRRRAGRAGHARAPCRSPSH